MKRLLFMLIVAALAGCGSTTPLAHFDPPKLKMSQIDSLAHANEVRLLIQTLNRER